MATATFPQIELALRALRLQEEYRAINEDEGLATQYGVPIPRAAEDIAAEYVEVIKALVAS